VTHAVYILAGSRIGREVSGVASAMVVMPAAAVAYTIIVMVTA